MSGMILRLLKYIIILFAVSTVGMSVLMSIVALLGYIAPDFMNTIPFYRSFKLLIVKPTEAVYILVFVASFFVISFKLFKDKNLLTKIVYSCLFFMVYFFIANIFKRNDVVIYILMLVPVITAILLLIIKRKRKPKNVVPENLQFSKKEQEIKGFAFKTTKGSIHLDNPFRGIYIQGGAGSGKSLSIFEPIIRQSAQNSYTGLLYDFKSPELSKLLLEVYKQTNNNIKTHFVDFNNPYNSNRLNPIDARYLLKSAYALEYATTLINNLLPQTIKERDFFSDNARMVLAGVIWYLRNRYSHYCSLPHVISLLLHNDIDKLIEEISQDYEAGGMVASLKQAIDRGAERQSAGVASTLQNALSQLNTPDIFYILSGNDLDLHLNNPNNPKFLCLGNDSTLSQTYAPVISLIISVAVRQMNRPDQEKSIILLDEAPTIYIPNIELIPATARSNKVATVFGVQDYSQLVDKYGQDKAQVILSNLGNQFYGRTVNEKSADMITKLFGKHDRTYETANRGTGTSGEFVHLSSNTNKGTSESIQERDRVKVSDITNLEAGQFYGLIAEGQPKEFLKTQFLADGIKTTYQSQSKTTDQLMIDNYNRIVEEAKSIVV